MKIAVIDDDRFFIDKITSLLYTKYDKKDISTFESVHDYEEAHEYFDLLLLDIEMDQDSIRYAPLHTKYQSYIIYVSSHTEKMIEAFDQNVLGFIPKNMLEDMLLKKLEDVKQFLLKKPSCQIETTKGIYRIPENKIVCFYLSYETIYLEMIGVEAMKLKNRSLNELLKTLSEHFFKVNRDIIINILNIRKINPTKQEIILINDRVVKVSRRNWKELITTYQVLKYHD